MNYMEEQKNKEVSYENTQATINIEEPTLQKNNYIEPNISNIVDQTNNNSPENNHEKSNNLNNTNQNEIGTNKPSDNTTKKEKIPCKKKFSCCFCKIKCSFFVNFCDKKQRGEYCNKRSTECCCIIVLLYYYFFLWSELFYFIYLFFKYLFTCICPMLNKCCDDMMKANEKYIAEMKEKNRRIEAQFTKENIEELKNEQKNMDRTIYLNGITDPGYQARVIECRDAQYDKEIKELERKLENMNI